MAAAEQQPPARRAPSPFTERLQTYVLPGVGRQLHGLSGLARLSMAQIVTDALVLYLPLLAARLQEQAAAPEQAAAAAALCPAPADLTEHAKRRRPALEVAGDEAVSA